MYNILRPKILNHITIGKFYDYLCVWKSKNCIYFFIFQYYGFVIYGMAVKSDVDGVVDVSGVRDRGYVTILDAQETQVTYP